MNYSKDEEDYKFSPDKVIILDIESASNTPYSIGMISVEFGHEFFTLEEGVQHASPKQIMRI
jgi:hypothetical protein